MIRSSTKPTSATGVQKPVQAMGPTVYYDGSCPLCSREIGFYQRRESLSNLRWLDVTDCDESDLPAGVTREEALARFHVKLTDGSVMSGPSAFGVIWKQMKGFSWLGSLLQLKIMQPPLELLYRVFLKLRFSMIKRLNANAHSKCDRC